MSVTLAVGMRVHHRCEYPDCPLFGTILTLGSFRSKVVGDGRVYDEWALLEIEPHGNVPAGYRQWVPLERLEPA